jgi:methionyl-tRNA formyltransferase
MRIVIVTQEEPLYIPICLNNIMKTFKSDTVAIITLPGIPYGYNYITYLKKLYDIFGYLDFIKYGFLFLKYAIYNYLFFEHGRFYSVNKIAKKYNVPLYSINNINSVKSYELIKGLKPDYILSVAAPQIFKKQIIDLSKHAINVHGAMLPLYKGMMPGFWVLAKGERVTGVTLHYIDENIDHGDIILQREIEIDAKETFHSMQTKIAVVGGIVVEEGIRKLEQNEYDLIKPNMLSNSYYSLPTTEAVKVFRRRGYKFI